MTSPEYIFRRRTKSRIHILTLRLNPERFSMKGKASKRGRGERTGERTPPDLVVYREKFVERFLHHLTSSLESQAVDSGQWAMCLLL